jgi:hypothetical protein
VGEAGVLEHAAQRGDRLGAPGEAQGGVELGGQGVDDGRPELVEVSVVGLPGDEGGWAGAVVGEPRGGGLGVVDLEDARRWVGDA